MASFRGEKRTKTKGGVLGRSQISFSETTAKQNAIYQLQKEYALFPNVSQSETTILSNLMPMEGIERMNPLYLAAAIYIHNNISESQDPQRLQQMIVNDSSEIFNQVMERIATLTEEGKKKAFVDNLSISRRKFVILTYFNRYNEFLRPQT